MRCARQAIHRKVRPPGRDPRRAEGERCMPKVPRGGGASQSRRKRYPRLGREWVRGQLRFIADHLNVALAGHATASISRREAVTFLRCWDRAAAGSPLPLRQFVRRRQRAERGARDNRSATRSVLRDRQGRVVGRAESWNPSPEEVPPPSAGFPPSETYQWFLRFTSARSHFLGLV